MSENTHLSDDFLSHEIFSDLPAEKPVPASQVSKAEAALMARLDALPDTASVEGRGVVRARSLPMSAIRKLAAAAIFAAVLAGGWKLYNRFSTQEIATGYGQMSRQVLSDGSEVLLNANSKLVVEGRWAEGGERKVRVSGEVFFSVKKSVSHSPFIVQTDHLTIEVLGTQFNVVNRNGSESVFLKDGGIRVVGCDQRPVVMHPGDFMAFSGGKGGLRAVASDSLTAWQEQKLIFNKTSLKALKEILYDQYGVTVELGDSAIGDSTITAMLPNNNLDVLLNALRATSDFEVVREQDHIKITAPAKDK